MDKVYIIDDDRNIVESMSIVLKSHGYKVYAQYDEKNIINNLISEKPDIIILDVIFPENPDAGFDIAREIRKNGQTAGIPVIMLSAINEKGDYAVTFSNRDRDDSWLPVNEFIEKPIRPDQLLRKVKETLENAIWKSIKK